MEDSAWLEERPIEAQTESYAAFAELYETAFPPEERIEPQFLLDGADLSASSFTAYYDAGDFCGFTYEVELECALYLLFLAVNDKVRSRGYGTRILKQVKQHAGTKPVVLEIEPIDDAAPNADQRLKRLRFYERNGYSATGHQLIEQGIIYTVLATDGFSDMEAFKEDFSRIAPGFADFELITC